MGDTSKNSIAYQEYISGIPYGMAIRINGVNFDGCDPKTGILLEAKGDYDIFFDKNNMPVPWWSKREKMIKQFINQGKAAEKAGRSVLWCVQTQKSYEGIKNVYWGIDKKYRPTNVTIEYCPGP